MPLPLAAVWEQLQAEVERLTGEEAGLQILRATLEDEVRQRVGPPYRPDPAASNVRWGRQPGVDKWLAEGGCDCIGHAVDLFVGQLRVDGQREHLVGGALGHWKIPALVAER